MSEIALIIVIGIVIYSILMLSGVHTIHEGYVGIYKNYGVLQEKLSSPGVHFMIPFKETV